MNHNIRNFIVIVVAMLVGILIYQTIKSKQPEVSQSNQENQQQQDSRLNITSPQNGDIVSNPFTIQGQTQGWFEGHVPIKVFDSNNTLLYDGSVTVGDNYGQFQPFTKSVTLIATPTVNTGRIEFTEISNADGVTVTYQKIININF